MKIKEVIEKTGLSDRAIRLYIDEGLTAPRIEESYSGRKSIDFSESDVERLKNVALLRKAGFSISDIKSMVDNNSAAKDIIEKFIEQTESNIAHETEIVEKLKRISFDEEVTFETICISLSKTVEKKEVPKEDMHLSFMEKLKKDFPIFFAVMGIVLSVASLVIIVVFWKSEFIHTSIDNDTLPLFVLSYGSIAIVFILSLILLAINWRFPSVKKKLKNVASGAVALSMILFSVLAFYTSVFGSLLLSATICSQTTEIKDYLIFDGFVEDEFGEEIKKVFPDEIPESALSSSERVYEESHPWTTKYYYRHSYVLDPDFDIVAEWVLSQSEYEKAKKDLTGKEKYSFNKGDWTLLVFSDEYSAFPREKNEITNEQKFWVNNWNDDGYWYLFFAYNDKTNKVRYVAAHAIDSYEYGPYYLSLDW